MWGCICVVSNLMNPVWVKCRLMFGKEEVMCGVCVSVKEYVVHWM